MGGFFGGAPKPSPPPDTSYIDKQRADAEAQKAKIARENKSKRRNTRRGQGRKSLLLFDTAKGVTGGLSKTLG